MDERRFSSRFVFWLVLMTTRVVTRQFQWRPLDDESTTPTSTTHNNRVDLSFFRVFKSEHFFFFLGGCPFVCDTCPPTTTTATHLWWWWMTTTKNIIDFDVDIFSLYSGNTLEKVNTLAYTHCVSFFSLMKMNEFFKKKKNKKKENLQIPFYNHMVHF